MTHDPADHPTRRSPEDRRWCSDRRVTERRQRDAPVAVERRGGRDRRVRAARRSGFDRRGDRRCGAYLLDASRCSRDPILRDSTGAWWCIEHAAFSPTAEK